MFLCDLSLRQAATLTAIVDADFRSRGWSKTFEAGPHYDATLLKVVSRLRSCEASLDDIAVQFEEALWEMRYAS